MRTHRVAIGEEELDARHLFWQVRARTCGRVPVPGADAESSDPMAGFDGPWIAADIVEPQPADAPPPSTMKPRRRRWLLVVATIFQGTPASPDAITTSDAVGTGAG